MSRDELPYNDDIKTVNELEAVKQLIAKTQAAFVFKGRDVCPAKELLDELQKDYDRERKYLLDNGPWQNEPGVYNLNDIGEIEPNRLYAPAEQVEPASATYWTDYQSLRPSRIRFPFERNT